MPLFFHNHGHTDWPRGRVLYNTQNRVFEVNLNEQLRVEPFKTDIQAHFFLPEASTCFVVDPHYSEARFTIA